MKLALAETGFVFQSKTMFSTLDRSIVYEIGTDITEHDINIVSDLWTMGGRQVYRGARDPSFTHANVYWLYDPDDLDRIGVSEHTLDNPAEVALLWYKENPFGTLLQEDGWEEDETLWSELPEHVYEHFLAEEMITPQRFLERCIRGPVRVITTDMLIHPPSVYSCEKCHRLSLSPFVCSSKSNLTVPSKEKVFFIDDRMVMHLPPKDSRVWSLLGFTPQQLPSVSSEQQVSEPVLEPVEV